MMVVMKRHAHRLGTRVVHAGREVDQATGAVTPPIHLSTTFARDDSGGLMGEHFYSRIQNPNRAALEECVATLDGGAAAAAFASGSAAANGILQCLEPGDRVLYSADLYHGVRVLMEEVAALVGVRCESVALFDLTAARAALQGGARLVWCETPTNPSLRVVDVAALAELCAEAGATLVVDGTFATPVLQQPLALGADLVVHSTTKYLAGHGDVMGGMVVAADPETPLWQRLVRLQQMAGAVPSPFDCWLTLRGLSTLVVRMKQHVDNAEELARRLVEVAAVSEVAYPGLPDHPEHEVAARQMARPGGMLSLRLKGGEAAVSGFVSRLRWIPHATSLGGVHTLVEHRALVEPADSPVPRDLVRVSVGIEDVEDIWEDLAQALGS